MQEGDISDQPISAVAGLMMQPLNSTNGSPEVHCIACPDRRASRETTAHHLSLVLDTERSLALQVRPDR